ncbi:ATP-binding protein [Streptomyces lividans]
MDAQVFGDVRDRPARRADLADGPLAELVRVFAWCWHCSWFSLRARIISLASGTPRIRGQLKLFTALDLAGEPPRHPSEFDRLLKTALAERPRTFLVDEAQWLNGEAFEYFRYLWDEPSTQLAIIFVGGAAATPCCAVNRCCPPVSSSGSSSPASHPTRSSR